MDITADIAWTDMYWTFEGDMGWERLDPSTCAEIQAYRLQGRLEFCLASGIEINLNEWIAETDCVMRYIRPDSEWEMEEGEVWIPIVDGIGESLERACFACVDQYSIDGLGIINFQDMTLHRADGSMCRVQRIAERIGIESEELIRLASRDREWNVTISRVVYARDDRYRGWAAQLLWEATGEDCYLEEAAQAGCAAAEFEWAEVLRRRGGEEGVVLSEHFYVRAAEGGHAEAAYRVHELLEGEESGRRWLRESAAGGYALAKVKLADELRNEGGQKEAEVLLLEAMREGDEETSSRAAGVLARVRDEAGFENLDLLKWGAEAGDPSASGSLAAKYWAGIDTERDMDSALDYAIRAADSGLPGMAMMAGHEFYRRGEKGKARQYCERAHPHKAHAGESSRMLSILALEQGDLLRGFEYLAQAADEGDSGARLGLTLLYLVAGNRPAAVELVEEAVLNPNCDLLTLGKVLKARGEEALAELCFDRLVAWLRERVRAGDRLLAPSLADALEDPVVGRGDSVELEEALRAQIHWGIHGSQERLARLWEPTKSAQVDCCEMR
jgi:TPR repeat protein